MNNRVKIACVTAIIFFLPLSAWAQVSKLYFNQQGKLAVEASARQYERRYEEEGGRANVQDFYYPSMKKYSDPYQVPLSQVKSFVPVLEQGVLVLWHFNGQKKMSGPYKMASLTVNGLTGILMAKNQQSCLI